MKQKIIILGALAKLGGFIAINFPSFTSLLILKDFQISQIEFNLLFTVITFPNAFLPFIFGSLTKYMKPRTFILLMVFIILLGQSLCILAVIQKQYFFLVVGRLLVGLGHINSNQPKNQLVTNLFPFQNAFYFQLFPTIGRLGVFVSALYFAQFQNIHNNVTLLKPTILVWIITLISFICGIEMFRLDKKQEQKELEKLENLQNQYEQNPDLSFMSEDTQDALSRKSSAYEQENKKNNQENNKSIFQIIKELSIEYYIIMAICAIGLTLYFPLINNCQIIFKEKFMLTGPIAVYLQILPPLLSSILGLGIGKLMDKYGQRLHFCLLCGVLALLTNSITIFIQKWELIDNNIFFAFIYMVCLGFYESIFQLIELPCLSIIVPTDYLGVASGIDLAVQNNILSLSGLVMGKLTTPSYFYGHNFLQFDTLLFISSAIFLLLCLFLLYIDTTHYNSRLQLVYKDKKQKQQEKNQDETFLEELNIQLQQQQLDQNKNYSEQQQIVGFQKFEDEIQNQPQPKKLSLENNVKQQLELLQHILKKIKT